MTHSAAATASALGRRWRFVNGRFGRIGFLSLFSLSLSLSLSLFLSLSLWLSLSHALSLSFQIIRSWRIDGGLLRSINLARDSRTWERAHQLSRSSVPSADSWTVLGISSDLRIDDPPPAHKSIASRPQEKLAFQPRRQQKQPNETHSAPLKVLLEELCWNIDF